MRGESRKPIISHACVAQYGLLREKQISITESRRVRIASKEARNSQTLERDMSWAEAARAALSFAGKQAGRLVFATDPAVTKDLFGLHPNATHQKKTYEN
jgi:hypothetical protein